MDNETVIKAQSAIQSRTVQMLLAILIAYVVKNWGVALAPIEMQMALTEILTVAIPLMIAVAVWFRVKARTLIDSWWS
jgi:lipoprotein signal peptidase